MEGDNESPDVPSVVSPHHSEDEDTFENNESDDKPLGVKRKNKTQWNADRDLFLLTNAEEIKPFLEKGNKAGEKWTIIANLISNAFDIDVRDIGAKNRFKFLLDDSDCLETKRGYKSATEAQIAAVRDKVIHLNHTLDNKRGSSVEAFKASPESGKPDEAEKESSGPKPVRQDDGPKLKRKRHSGVADQCSGHVSWNDKKMIPDDTMQQKSLEEKAEFEIQLKQLEVRKIELELQQKEFDHRKEIELHEIKMKCQRFDLEREERIAMLSAQKFMMELVMKKLNN